MQNDAITGHADPTLWERYSQYLPNAGVALANHLDPGALVHGIPGVSNVAHGARAAYEAYQAIHDPDHRLSHITAAGLDALRAIPNPVSALAGAGRRAFGLGAMAYHQLAPQTEVHGAIGGE